MLSLVIGEVIAVGLGVILGVALWELRFRIRCYTVNRRFRGGL